MAGPGYYRWPTIHGDTVVFVCEDDLWSVPAGGGVARRLTANPGSAGAPALSPDGATLAFTSRDEGPPEVYVMPADGGEARRLTYLGGNTRVVGWSPDGEIVLASAARSPFDHSSLLYTVAPDGGEPRLIPVGPAVSISYGPGGAAVLGRNTRDLAHWKRYRGGTTGDLWVDADGSGEWRRLVQLPGNVALPLWVGERIYFVSDHEGVGNLYSCLPTGEDLRRHTRHAAYYARFPATDGRRIVYHAGADLFLFDPQAGESRRIEVEYHSPRAQRKRRFVDASRYLQGYAVHPAGHALALTVRGKPVTMGAWEGAAVQHGEPGAARYRLAAWLDDGRRIVALGDSGGEERLEVFAADASAPAERLDDIDIGRVHQIAPAPREPLVALANQRNELLLVSLATKSSRLLAQAEDRITGLAWSPDGRWLAYSFPATQRTSAIHLCEVATGAVTPASRPVLRDYGPAWDPDGKYLYFISAREFTPVYDELHFDLGFIRATRPFLVTLRADLPSPFVPVPPKVDPEKPEPAESAPKAGSDAADSEMKPEVEAKPAGVDRKSEPLRIDLEGLADRVVAFPGPAGRYLRLAGLPGKVLMHTYPVEPSDEDDGPPGQPKARGKLEAYDFESQSRETLVDGISSFAVSRDRKTLVYRAAGKLRSVKAGVKPEDKGQEPGRKSGWVDLGRVRVAVTPPDEWRQIFRETWRLQRDFFWTPDMSGVDWQAVYTRYLPLVDRVATRGELTDLLWEMQGELGTSHAYAWGGDERPEPRYGVGKLGAELRYDASTDSYVVESVIAGDVWSEQAGSPLARPGVNVRAGDRIVAVNGRRVGRDLPLGEALTNMGRQEVLLTIAPAGGGQRSVTVKTLGGEGALRYRDWVESNRRAVHAASDGRLGYVHIPDMSVRGYAEFHRGFLPELDRAGLIVDVRFNGGGHVSQLIAEKLARRRVAYAVSRWGSPEPYPSDSVLGPIVAVTNEHAGSDGDIISHVIKLLKIGPLIGKRTWGGVIGINVDDTLADGGVVTQPQYAFWFQDVGWAVENYGTEPDIEVEMRPQDYAAGRDPQLDRAVAEALRLMEQAPPALPAFGERPRLPLPLPEG